MISSLENNGLNAKPTPDGAVIRWSNREIPINRLQFSLYILGWLLITPLTFFLTSSLLQDLVRWQQGLFSGWVSLLISSLFFALSLGATLFITYTLLGWTWEEEISIREEGIQIGFAGWLAPKEKVIPRDDIWRISYERLQSKSDREMNFTLNVFHGSKRETLGFWMNRAAKKNLYLFIQDTIENQGWSYIEFKLKEKID